MQFNHLISTFISPWTVASGHQEELAKLGSPEVSPAGWQTSGRPPAVSTARVAAVGEHLGRVQPVVPVVLAARH